MSTSLPRSLQLAIAVALLATLSPACAQNNRRAQAVEAAQARLSAADADADGYIDRSEAEASMPRLAEHFDRVDADGDGRISKDEFRDAAKGLRQRGGKGGWR